VLIFNTELLHPSKSVAKPEETVLPPAREKEDEAFGLTEDEERELAELMDD
jgi:hypothetical protein